jgi:hypothetical protein
MTRLIDSGYRTLTKFCSFVILRTKSYQCDLFIYSHFPPASSIRSFFCQAIEDFYAEASNDYRENPKKQEIFVFNFGFILKYAWTKVATSIAESGFPSRGIIPFNENTVEDHELFTFICPLIS